MKVTLLALVASFLYDKALAGWTDAAVLSTPANTDNECNSNQEAGFDWTGLPTGSFSSFGGLDFSGFSCTNSFAPAKRSLRTRQDFQVWTY